jgi:hypothetical protein
MQTTMSLCPVYLYPRLGKSSDIDPQWCNIRTNVGCKISHISPNYLGSQQIECKRHDTSSMLHNFWMDNLILNFWYLTSYTLNQWINSAYSTKYKTAYRYFFYTSILNQRTFSIPSFTKTSQIIGNIRFIQCTFLQKHCPKMKILVICILRVYKQSYKQFKRMFYNSLFWGNRKVR